jgi:hypothetical protein
MAHPLNSTLYAQYQAFRLTDIDNLSYVTWLEQKTSLLCVVGSHLGRTADSIIQWLKNNDERSHRGVITVLQKAVTLWNRAEQPSTKEPGNV